EERKQGGRASLALEPGAAPTGIAPGTVWRTPDGDRILSPGECALVRAGLARAWDAVETACDPPGGGISGVRPPCVGTAPLAGLQVRDAHGYGCRPVSPPSAASPLPGRCAPRVARRRMSTPIARPSARRTEARWEGPPSEQVRAMRVCRI